MVEKYLELNEQKKFLEDECEELKKQIKMEMRCQDLKEFKTDDTEVFYAECTRKTLDKNKLSSFISEEDIEKCYKESSYDRIDIKRKADE